MTGSLSTLYQLLLCSIACICIVGVLHSKYFDNFAQRAGMSITAIGCVIEIFLNDHQLEGAKGFFLIVVGVFAYCLGTVYKQWQQNKDPIGFVRQSLDQHRSKHTRHSRKSSGT